MLVREAATSVTLTHESEGGFSVVIYNADQTSLTIKESGLYKGSVRFQSPGIITVIADGNWTITPSQAG